MKIYKNFVLKVLLLINFAILSILCDYCTEETCRKCCQVTPTGCINSVGVYSFGLRGSNLTFCNDCSCDSEGSGCGWKVNNFQRVECTTCDAIKSSVSYNNIAAGGCGITSFNGDIVYTTLPNPYS